MHICRQTRRFVVGGDGTFDLFGKNWNWDSYFQHGETDTSDQDLQHAAVERPGESGDRRAAGSAHCSRASTWRRTRWSIAAGNIVCRNTIAQSFGCVPFNPFGGATDQPGGAVAYFDNQNVPGGTTIGTSRDPDQPPGSLQLRGQRFADRGLGRPGRGRVPVTNIAKSITRQRADPYAAGVTASTPATVNEPCTDPFVDCGLDHLRAPPGRLERRQLSRTAAAPIM